MVRFVRLNRISILESSAAFQSLDQDSPIFLANPDIRIESLLSENGLAVHPLPDGGAPDGSTVILNDRPIYELVYVADRLLGPGGCPWDREQTHESLKQYLLEEAYEVLDAIDAGSSAKLREELGDLMLQPIIHAQMKKIAGEFDIDDVATEIVDKLV